MKAYQKLKDSLNVQLHLLGKSETNYNKGEIPLELLKLDKKYYDLVVETVYWIVEDFFDDNLFVEFDEQKQEEYTNKINIAIEQFYINTSEFTSNEKEFSELLVGEWAYLLDLFNNADGTSDTSVLKLFSDELFEDYVVL